MKPVYKSPREIFYENLKLGDEVEYHNERMTILKVYKIGAGIRVFDLESDTHTHTEVPEWCCSKPKYTLSELV